MGKLPAFSVPQLAQAFNTMVLPLLGVDDRLGACEWTIPRLIEGGRGRLECLISALVAESVWFKISLPRKINVRPEKTISLYLSDKRMV